VRRDLVKVRMVGNLREIVVEMGLFDFGVYAVIGPSSELEAYVRKIQTDPAIPADVTQGDGWCFLSHKNPPVIWIPKNPETPEEYGTLAHECLHAVFDLMDWACIKTTEETDEIMTHALSWLITSILSGSAKKLRVKKPKGGLVCPVTLNESVPPVEK
jgi:hypothetical protein